MYLDRLTTNVAVRQRLEREVVVEENRVVVPWGATLDQISDALRELVKTWEPSWAPA